jgi:hypothetical protein
MKIRTRLSLLLLTAALATVGSPAPASAVGMQVSIPGVVSGSFDVQVFANAVFFGRTDDDLLLSFGFTVSVLDPTNVTFTGADAGAGFDAVTTKPGTDVFAAASGLGIAPPVSSLVLATLHFTTLAPGDTTIFVNVNKANPFQGLQYLNAPFVEGNASSVTVRVASPPPSVPEPTTLVLSGIGLIGLAARARKGVSGRRTGN